MARPAKFDRGEALTAAMHAIWRNGYEAASVKALSEMLGITRSSFYNAFGSREDLFREAMTEYAAESPNAPLGGDIASPVLPLLTQVFREICRARASDPDGRGCMIVNTVAELCPSPDGLGAELAEVVLGSAAQFERLLEIAKAVGEIPAEVNTHATALALQNLMVGLNVLCKVVRSEDELWLLARTTLKGLGLLWEANGAKL